MNEWRLLKLSEFDAETNMAIDEALFHSAFMDDFPPTLRFYTWENYSISLGYFQEIEDDIDLSYCHKHKIKIVKRLTGGKAVLHKDDLTYSIVCGKNGNIFPKNILETHYMISKCILQTVINIGVEATLSKHSTGDKNPFCFLSPSHYEILVHNKKLVGSAQRRSGSVFLQHGSIPISIDTKLCAEVFMNNGLLLDERIKRIENRVTSLSDELGYKIDPEKLQYIFLQSFEDQLGIKFFEGNLTSDENNLVNKLIEKQDINIQYHFT